MSYREILSILVVGASGLIMILMAINDFNKRPQRWNMKATKANSNKMPVDICDLLFTKIQEPKNLEKCKATNVYGDRYRIDLYTKNYDNIYDLEKIKLDQSFFCSFNGETLLFGKAKDRKIYWDEDPNHIIPLPTKSPSAPHTFSSKEEDYGATFSLRKK